jgi:hypothetical protein
VTPARLRVLAVALFVAAAVLTAVAGREDGPLFAAGVACFLLGVVAFFRWRQTQRAEAERGSVFAREEKTAEEAQE